MKIIRVFCLLLALATITSFVGCKNTEAPPETTEAESDTGAPDTLGTAEPEATEAESTEPAETEPPYPVYEGPSDDFKFTQENVLGDISYTSYKDFVAAAEKSYLIPALGQQMIPQGMDIWEERGWLLISGYFPNTRSTGMTSAARSASLIASNSPSVWAISRVKPDASVRASVFIVPPQPSLAPISERSVLI